MVTLLNNGDHINTDFDAKVDHEVEYFINLLCITGNDQDSSLTNYCIPPLVDDAMNNMPPMVTSPVEISNVVFNLNKGSSHGLDGFGGIFF